jgi:hypothetical protein
MSASLDTTAVERAIIEGVKQEMVKACGRLADSLRDTVPSLLDTALRAQPEYSSLVSGKLREEFGLEDAAPMVESVIDAVKAGVGVELTQAQGKDALAGVFVGVYQEKFADALAASGASYVSHSKGNRIRGKAPNALLVPWLQWLLFAGDDLVLAKAEILYDYPNRKINFRSSSRTGKAIMVTREYEPSGSSAARYNRSLKHSHNIVRSAGWRVPPEFAGVESNNWLTKAGDVVASQLEAKVVEFFGA